MKVNSRRPSHQMKEFGERDQGDEAQTHQGMTPPEIRVGGNRRPLRDHSGDPGPDKGPLGPGRFLNGQSNPFQQEARCRHYQQPCGHYRVFQPALQPRDLLNISANQGPDDPGHQEEAPDFHGGLKKKMALTHQKGRPILVYGQQHGADEQNDKSPEYQ